MDWNGLVANATDVIMDTIGVPAVYFNSSGGIVDLRVSIDRDVEVVDETGAYARKAMASFRSDAIDQVGTGDWIDVEDGDVWDVEMLNTDDGYLKQVIVRPRA